MKLTLYHRTEILRALIYRRLIHRTEPNRPHISSDISISNNVETKQYKMRPKLSARPACNISIFLLRRVSRKTVWRPDPHRCTACEGGSTVTRQRPQVVFCTICDFSSNPDFLGVLNGLTQFYYVDPREVRRFLRQNGNRTYNIWGYPQGDPQVTLDELMPCAKKPARVAPIYAFADCRWRHMCVYRVATSTKMIIR